MNITRSGVRDMIQQITSNDRYGSSGHHCDEDFAQDVVIGLSHYVKDGPEFMYIPDSAVPYLGGTLGDIIAGYGRPLGYLCSDCRYPKWCMTPDEVIKKHEKNKALMARAENPLPNGFTDITPACPKCGD